MQQSTDVAACRVAQIEEKANIEILNQQICVFQLYNIIHHGYLFAPPENRKSRARCPSTQKVVAPFCIRLSGVHRRLFVLADDPPADDRQFQADTPKC